MSRLPEGSTKDSYTLFRIGSELTQSCPPELGQEIVIVGSVGWGKADANSDIDLEFWVETMPTLEIAQAWLQGAGVVNLIPDTDPEANEINIIGHFQKVWLEASWREIGNKEKLIQAIVAGETTSRAHLTQAWNITHAVALRTSGVLHKWQQMLAHYPEVVQERVIVSASAFWTFPHRVDMLWILAHRQELLGLTTWLMADVSDALRILFAINRQWEMDWKHLHLASQTLSVKPTRLVERVDEVFSAMQFEQRVSTSMQLILDILELVPSTYNVSSAITNIRQSLQTHTTIALQED